MSDSSFTTAIEELKRSQRWKELSELYKSLSIQEQNLEQRLFYDWERATLLATELDDPAGAIAVLLEATLLGGPIELIAPQIEAIRQAASERIDAQEQAVNAFKTLSTRSPLSRLTVDIRAWMREAESLVASLEPPIATPTALGSPAIVDSNALAETTQESEYDELDSSLLEEADIISESISPKVLLSAQATALEGINGEDKLRGELSLNSAISEPLRFMNDLLALRELGELSTEDLDHYEPLLWRAATEGDQWRLWVKVYETVFLGNMHHVGEVEANRAFTLASIIELKLEDFDRAVELYALVLDHDPCHDEAFDRLRSLLKTLERWDELGKLLLRFASTLNLQGQLHWSQDARFEMCLEAGDCYAQQLDNYAKAITAWFAALEVNPESKQIFVRLVEVYQKSQKWSACIKVLRKLSTLETDPKKAAFHLYTIGLIQRDQLCDRYLAVRSFDEALDIDPHFMKAFQEIDDTLDREELDTTVIERRDRYYRKMLIRAVNQGFEPSMIVELAMQVGELNGHQLNRWTEARQAYELALEYEPGHDEAHASLIEAIVATEGAEASLPYLFEWVRQCPQQVLSYLALFERSLEAGAWDHAWCAAMTLRALEQTTPEALKHLEAGHELLGSQLPRPLSEDEWRSLEWADFTWGGSGDEWGAVFEVLGAQLLQVAESSLKTINLNHKRDRVPEDDSTVIGRVASYISRTFHLNRTPIWLSSNLAGKLMCTRFIHGEVALILNREVISQLSVEELACTLTVGLMLSQRNTAVILSPLQTQLMTSLHSVLIDLGYLKIRSIEVTSLNKEAQSIRGHIQKLDAQRLRSLEESISLLVKLGNMESNDLGELRWLRAVEQTCFRASLLICSDPSLVMMLMRGLSKLSADDEAMKSQRLALFSVSPTYLRLRERLGISWGAS